MTGYARVRAETDDLSMTITLKSVNHRFMDMQIRMPPELDSLEPQIRRVAKEHVRRGQVQLGIMLDWNAPVQETRVNRALVEGYVAAFREIAEQQKIAAEPDLNALLRVPGAVTIVSGELDAERRALLEETLTNTLVDGLKALNETRQTEGAGIVDDLNKRVKNIGDSVEELLTVREDTIKHFQSRLEEKLTELLDRVEVEPQRILQEAAILTDRADINEEIQRLRSHMERFAELINGDGEIGKQIDFIAQELNRETNTILSKSSALGQAGIAVSEIGVRLKGEIDKIREQAQNLE
jgi:uncharacterized protein (TIGR00255 family)